MRTATRTLLRWAWAASTVTLCAIAVMAWPAFAGATFPGVNGTIAWQDYTATNPISGATPDGAFHRRLTDPGDHPTWSPDGSLLRSAR